MRKFKIGDNVRITDRAPKSVRKTAWPRRVTKIDCYMTANGLRSLYKVKGLTTSLFSYELRKAK